MRTNHCVSCWRSVAASRCSSRRRRVAAGSAARPGRKRARRAAPTASAGQTDFGFTDSFDPTGEYLGDAFGIYSNLLIRTLVGYNHVAGAAGNKIVPDIATAVPKPTNGGKTYTFHLKPGVKFGPPVNRAVTSQDIVYAMQRLANPKDGGQYAFYYDVDQAGFRAGPTRRARRRRSPASRRRTRARSSST